MDTGVPDRVDDGKHFIQNDRKSDHCQYDSGVEILSEHEEPVYPVKPGDWVAHRYNDTRFGRIKDVMIDRGETLVHIVLYSHSGEKIGRESAILGGPRTYEPCCDYSNWHRIDKPDFPVSLKWIDNGDGTMTPRYRSGPALPDRKWIRPVRKPRALPIIHIQDNNQDTEIAALKRAAQELRDAAKAFGVPQLLERAQQLEREAESLGKAL
jgi:hypothetical protein